MTSKKDSNSRAKNGTADSQSTPVRAGGVLLMQRRTKDSQPKQFLLMRHADRWDLPKGHCDGDETFLQTAKREFTEETGVAAADVDWCDAFQFDLQYEIEKKRGIKRKHVRYYLAYCKKRPQIEPTEHPGYQWMPWSPPHHIQEQTVDPLLNAVAKHLATD